MAEGQWADSVPKLVQSKMVESFENAGFAHVGKATDGFTPEVQLLLEIRSFRSRSRRRPRRGSRFPPSARRRRQDRGRARFQRHGAASGVDSPAAAAALNAAFQTIARESWTGP